MSNSNSMKMFMNIRLCDYMEYEHNNTQESNAIITIFGKVNNILVVLKCFDSIIV